MSLLSLVYLLSTTVIQMMLGEVEAAGSRDQKWKLDPRGRMIHKASGKLLALTGQGQVCRGAIMGRN